MKTLIRLREYAEAQADLNLRWAHISDQNARFLSCGILVYCRQQLDSDYKRQLRLGVHLDEEPPGYCEVSNMLCSQFFCGTDAANIYNVYNKQSTIEQKNKLTNGKSVHLLTGKL